MTAYVKMRDGKGLPDPGLPFGKRWPRGKRLHIPQSARERALRGDSYSARIPMREELRRAGLMS